MHTYDDKYPTRPDPNPVPMNFVDPSLYKCYTDVLCLLGTQKTKASRHCPNVGRGENDIYLKTCTKRILNPYARQCHALTIVPRPSLCNKKVNLRGVYFS